MKTITRSCTTYLIPGIEIEVELDHEPSSIMDYREPLVRRTGDKVVLGYLVDDDNCRNPLEDDGMGHIYECRRHGDTLRDYEKALGLADGDPDLDLVDEDEVVKMALERILADSELRFGALNHCNMYWKAEDGDTEDTFITRCLDSIDELTPVFDVLALQLELWCAGHAAGTIGNKHAVLLDVYEHSQISYRLSGTGMQDQFDTARGGAVWVPDDCLLEDIEAAADRAARARELAKQAYEVYADWRNGNCFGIVVVTYDLQGKLLDEDACYGFVGDDHAYESLKSDYFPKEV